jgi:hypothetical protein
MLLKEELELNHAKLRLNALDHVVEEVEQPAPPEET